MFSQAASQSRREFALWCVVRQGIVAEIVIDEGIDIFGSRSERGDLDAYNIESVIEIAAEESVLDGLCERSIG